MIAIDVHALRKSYGAVHALRGIDLTIRGHRTNRRTARSQRRRQDHARRDPRRTARRRRPARCRCSASTRPRASNQLRARLGVQLQATAFMPELTVVETLRLYGSAVSALAARRAECCERVNLADKAQGAGPHAVRRPEAAPCARDGDAARPGSLHPRRAHVGPRSDRAPPDPRHPAGPHAATARPC